MIVPSEKGDARHIRVCHVISGDLWGGAEAQALALIQKLADTVDVCAVVFNRGELYARIEASRISVEVADERVLGFAGLVRRLHSLLGKWRPDLVHVHGFKENLIAGTAARLRGIPVVRTHHGRGMIGAARRHTYIERFNAAFLTDGLIAVSKDLAEFLRGSGLSLRKLQVIRNGIALPADAGHAEQPTAAATGQRRFTIGTVGRLVTVKNHKCLLEAFKRVHDEIEGARLLIVGDGPLTAQLESQAAQLGISNQVEFAGFQRNVADYLRRMDVFVLSSLHEGVPISLLEAMSMRIPVVCTRVGGIPEVVTDNHNGLLVDSNDAVSLAAALKKIAVDRDFAERLAANAWSTVTGELSFENCLASTISLYRATIPK